MSDCTVCPGGSYLEDNATAREYHDHLGDCQVCEAGKVNVDLGLSQDNHDNINDCSECSAGKYLSDDSTDKNTEEDNDKDKNLIPNFHLHDSDHDAASSDCIKCPTGKVSASSGPVSYTHLTLPTICSV